MPQQLASARRHSQVSAAIARHAVQEARKVSSRGTTAIASVVAAHQVAQTVRSQTAVAEMLSEQAIEQAAEALLNSLAFTTSVDAFVRMIDAAAADAEALMDRRIQETAVRFGNVENIPTLTPEARTDRLVASLVQDAGRAAEGVAVAVRPRVYWTRFVNPPCCSRCAILAGRRYRWSDGFQRHPGCDCSILATGEQSPYVLSPEELLATGQVRGLSKADAQALADGADLNQVVNVRKKSSGLMNGGQSLARAGRPTPAGIYALADGDRGRALELLGQYGYIR